MFASGWYDGASVRCQTWRHYYGGLTLDERGKHWITDQGMWRSLSSISFEAKQPSNWILYCSCYIWCDWLRGAIDHENQYTFCDISRCDTMKKCDYMLYVVIMMFCCCQLMDYRIWRPTRFCVTFLSKSIHPTTRLRLLDMILWMCCK